MLKKALRVCSTELDACYAIPTSADERQQRRAVWTMVRHVLLKGETIMSTVVTLCPAIWKRERDTLGQLYVKVLCLFMHYLHPYCQRERSYSVERLCSILGTKCLATHLFHEDHFSVEYVPDMLKGCSRKVTSTLHRVLDRLHERQLWEQSHTKRKRACTQEPPHFVDQISGECMRVPVKLPSGNVVDRSTLERCKQGDVLFDPFTMQPIPGDLPTCLELQKKIQKYVDRYK